MTRAFTQELRARNPDPGRRRWLFVAYDQLSDAIGPLSREDPSELGIVLVESPWKAARRPYHRQKLALVLANLRHFALDEEVQLRSILGDLRDSGLILQLGRGPATSYRASTRDELSQLGGSEEGLRLLVWLVIYRQGPLSAEQLRAEMPSVSPEQLDLVLDLLVSSGRASRQGDLLMSQEVVVAASDPHGWEAALLDHFQALVRTLVTRLRGDADPQRNGGSTYGFELGPKHPLASDVYGFLDRTRRELSALRQRVEDFNQDNPQEPRSERVTLYFGQHVIGEQDNVESDNEDNDD